MPPTSRRGRCPRPKSWSCPSVGKRGLGWGLTWTFLRVNLLLVEGGQLGLEVVLGEEEHPCEEDALVGGVGNYPEPDNKIFDAVVALGRQLDLLAVEGVLVFEQQSFDFSITQPRRFLKLYTAYTTYA